MRVGALSVLDPKANGIVLEGLPRWLRRWLRRIPRRALDVAVGIVSRLGAHGIGHGDIVVSLDVDLALPGLTAMAAPRAALALLLLPPRG